MNNSFSIKIVLLITCFFSSQINANDYTLTITDANHHLAEVEIVFKGVKTKSFSVKLPVWRTGRYQVLNLPTNIRNFQALDANDEPLQFQKDDKNTWRILINTPNIVKVKYQVYANLLRSRVSHIDETHAFLDATGVFMYSESQRDNPLTVTLNVPQDWRSVSGMESIGLHQFKADSYDQLVDSPIESGIHTFDSIKVEEQTYEIVIWGDGNFDMDRLKKDIEKLHFEAKAIWKTFPFKRYVYMYHAGDNLRGATEHVNSTIIQTDRLGFYPDKNYNKLIATTAHEFVHTWNVKSYRPAGITPYDYSKENYSDLFWMAEGMTSFYDNLLGVRSEIFSVKEYLENVAKDIHNFKNKPGRAVMSLAESSFDTWLPNNGNRAHNTTVSIYLKGSLVSWLMDKEIRELTSNKKNLDDLHYLLYKKYANAESGYTSYDVKQLLKKITGHDFSDFWNNYVEGTTEIDFDELLAFYGLQVEQKDKKANKDEEGDKKKPALSLGLNIKSVNGLSEITRMDFEGPAWKAGLAPGDQLIAIEGFRINNNLDKHLENLEEGKSYDLTYFNQGQLKATKVSPIKGQPKKIKIVALDSVTKKQKKHFKSLTNQDHKKSFTK
jgi:predicted metalloprotease with PDZ domain